MIQIQNSAGLVGYHSAHTHHFICGTICKGNNGGGILYVNVGVLHGSAGDVRHEEECQAVDVLGHTGLATGENLSRNLANSATHVAGGIAVVIINVGNHGQNQVLGIGHDGTIGVSVVHVAVSAVPILQVALLVTGGNLGGGVNSAVLAGGVQLNRHHQRGESTLYPNLATVGAVAVRNVARLGAGGSLSGYLNDGVRSLTALTANVAIAITSVVILVLFTAVSREIIDGTGLALIQRQGAAGRGGITGKTIGVVAAQSIVDALGLVALIRKFIGIAAADRPQRSIGRRTQNQLILSAVGVGIRFGGGIVQRPITVALGDLPNNSGGGIFNLIVGDGDGFHVQAAGGTILSRFHSAIVVDDQIITLGDGAAVFLKYVAVTAARLHTRIESVQHHVGYNGVVFARFIVGRHLGGVLHLALRPTHKGVAARQRTAVIGQSDDVTGIGDLLGHGAVCKGKPHGGLGTLGKVNADGHVRSGDDVEHVAIAVDSGTAAEDSIAADSITRLRSSGDGRTLHRNGTIVRIIGVGSDGVADRRTLSGGRSVILRHSLVKQQEGQLGIVYEYVTGTGDRFHRVVATQLPGIHGIFFHPLEQNLFALHNTGGAPHIIQSTIVIRTATPTYVDVQHDTGHVATQIVRAVALRIGVVEFAALTIGGVATAGVFAHRGGTEHHNVRLALGIGVTAAVTLTVRPSVLTIPSRATIPFGTDRLAGIEGRDGSAAILTVGVFEQISGISIGRRSIQVIVHQLV